MTRKQIVAKIKAAWVWLKHELSLSNYMALQGSDGLWRIYNRDGERLTEEPPLSTQEQADARIADIDRKDRWE